MRGVNEVGWGGGGGEGVNYNGLPHRPSSPSIPTNRPPDDDNKNNNNNVVANYSGDIVLFLYASITLSMVK